MICEVCKKNQAKIHITQLKENKKFMIHICHDCSHEIGIDSPISGASFSIENFLSDTAQNKKTSVADQSAQPTCPTCGLSYGAFKESSRLGCSNCYDTFATQLKPLLQKVQKEIKHVGKIPCQGDALLALKRSVTDMKMQLKNAVQKEHFELAAQLRDQIHQVEDELSRYNEKTN